MAYEIQFKDRTSTIIESHEGEKLKQLLLTLKQPRNIELNGELYSTTQIVAVKHATMPTVDLPNWDRPVLPAGKTSGCRGEKSLARELMRVANKRKDFKLLADKKWRAEQKAVLVDSGQKFCDATTGECACSPA